MTFLNTEEAAQLFAACPQAHALEGLPEEQAEDLIQWAESIRLANTCLELVLAGKLQIKIIDGEPCFSAVKNGKTTSS